jgi:creatinine amidohydrolase
MLPKRDWNEMTWQDFAGADTREWIAVLPVAATEQHGPHLPLGVDAMIGRAYIARARPLIPADLPVTFLPMQDVGVSIEHTAYPGTLTVSAETIIRAWTDIGDSVARVGVRKLIVMTSHGGNVPTVDIVTRALRVKHGMLAVTCAWHNFGYPDGLFTPAERAHGIHAGGIETSLMLAAHRDLVRMDKAPSGMPATVVMEQKFKQLRAHRPAGFGWMSQDIDPCGAIGDGTMGDAAKGEATYDHGARAFVELLHDVAAFDLAQLGKGPLGK